MPNIAVTLENAASVLRNAEIAEPRREAASLLAFALDKDKIFLIAHSEYALSNAEEIHFNNLLQRRALGEPLQQIAGKQEFYGLDFIVTKDVLIPRPETELIVENAVEILRPMGNPRFCEVGIGSGCISVAILHELKNARAVGLDISASALQIARKNAEKHGVSDQLDLKISDVFAVLHHGKNEKNEKFELIVSNPPYIPQSEFEGLQKEVRDFEPHVALTDGGDGFLIIEKIIENAPLFLKTGGFLLMEIGFGQAPNALAMFDLKIWTAVEIAPDLQGIPRMIRAKI